MCLYVWDYILGWVGFGGIYVCPVSMEALGWARWWGLLFAGPVCVSFFVVVVGLCLLLEGYFVLWLVPLRVALSFVGLVQGRGCLYCGGFHWFCVEGFRHIECNVSS